jgi:hypothetical protein
MFDIQADDLVLVAVMNNPRDLDIARVLGWYRIPLQTAPKTIRADWLAFYLTAAFGDERWAVRYAAQVRGVELVQRGDLLQDDPDHARAGEPYYKLQIGPLRRLPRPIPSRRWRRLTFLFTTGERLLRATDVIDLRVPPSREHDLLWKLLRERSASVGPSEG